MENMFIESNLMRDGSEYTENGALSYASTGSELLNQFAKCGTAISRSLLEVWADQAKLWNEDNLNSLKFAFYLRMITRQCNIRNGVKTEKVQRGQGLRDESFKRLLWFAKYHPSLFYNNIHLLGIIGSFKDFWKLMVMGKGYVNNQAIFAIIAEAITDNSAKDLVKKYLPRIRPINKCKTEWAKESNELAKEFCKFVGWSYRDYRLFKSTGKAHDFQKIICNGLYSKINWNLIPGKALLTLISGNFINRHNLTESYSSWIEKQPVAKFNGYAYELGEKLDNICSNKQTPLSALQKMTIDKQFDNLIKTAKKDNGALKGNILCAIDTSGSMDDRINGTNITSYDVCVSLGIEFSEMNTGAFHNVIAMFDDVSRLKTISGSFSDKWIQIRKSEIAWGSTNFQSLIDLICETREKNPNIPIEDFPETLLVISDMQFNPTGTKESNFSMAKAKLMKYFPENFVKKFKIIWWNCAGRFTKDFPSTIKNSGTYLFSGFDGSIISFLLGGDDSASNQEISMDKIVQDALNQEALLLIKS